MRGFAGRFTSRCNRFRQVAVSPGWLFPTKIAPYIYVCLPHSDFYRCFPNPGNGSTPDLRSEAGDGGAPTLRSGSGEAGYQF